MANGILAFEGDVPESIKKAANKKLADYAKDSLKYQGGMRESVSKAAQKAIDASKAKAFEMGPRAIQGGLLSKEAAEYLASQKAPQAAPTVAPKVASALATGSGLGTVFSTIPDVVGILQGNKDFKENPRLKNQMGMDKEKYAGAGMQASPFDKPLRDITSEDIISGLRSLNSSGAEAAAPDKSAAQVVAETAQTTPAPQVAAVEQKRQVVEAGAKEQLRTNQLSRPKAAEAVVQADIKRTGEKVTPEEMKTRVNQEVASMKSMDNDQLSKYLSYALVAGGLIASHLDESGAAGQAFAGGFNAQLDRNQQAALFKAKQQAAAEAAAQEGAFKTRELDIKETEAASKAADRKADNTLNETKTMALLSKWEQEAANADAKLAAYRERTNATAAGGSKNAPKGTPLSDKENISAINAYAEANGMEVDPAAASSLANQLKFLQKERPGQTMKTYIDTLFKMGGYGKSTEDGFFSDTTTLKLQ